MYSVWGESTAGRSRRFVLGGDVCLVVGVQTLSSSYCAAPRRSPGQFLARRCVAAVGGGGKFRGVLLKG
eukprot:11259096-Alexandrium_andersonii.AAC.1